MFQCILVPLDGSSRAERALAVAARVARVSGGSILLLQVVSPPVDYGGGMAQALLLTEQVIETELAVSSGYLDRVAKARELTGIETATRAHHIPRNASDEEERNIPLEPPGCHC